MAFRNPSDDVIRGILAPTRRIAVVGCSPNPGRDSHRIARLLIDRRHHVVPVNPRARDVLDRVCYPSIRDIPDPIEMVDVFRRSEHVAEIVEQAIEKGAKVVWTQLGVGDERAAARAQAAGITVVRDRSPAIEYRRLF